MRIPEGEEKYFVAEKVFEEIMAENSPNWTKHIYLHIKEA